MTLTAKPIWAERKDHKNIRFSRETYWKTDILIPSIHYTIRLIFSPWLLKQPVVILDLKKLPKNKTHPLIYQEKLNNIQERYPTPLHIFTDGSKNNGAGYKAILHKKT